jgi:glutathione S-transferase
MYKAIDKERRAAELAELVRQLDVLEGLAVGPFLAGSSISSADGALAPTFAFITYILPKYFGWADVFAGRPKLAAWWAAVNADPVASRVGRLLLQGVCAAGGGSCADCAGLASPCGLCQR